jgi:flagellar biogenesis protein FliO
MTGTYIQMIIALAAVIGMIFLMSFFLKKRQGKSGVINILAYQSFGPKKGIAALKMGREVLLIGITSTDIRLLKTFKENEFDEHTSPEINSKLKMLRDIKERFNEYK